MIISKIVGGIGNQLFQYAAGRRLAHKFNTELKLDLLGYKYFGNFTPFVLNEFNITATIATPEEVKSLIERQVDSTIKEGNQKTKYNIWNCSDNTYVRGYWEREEYFTDIADILRKEFTLKNPLSSDAEIWKQKILSAECPVSLHVRHGDFVYNPRFEERQDFARLPLDYYYECVKRLKEQYKNITIFIFSSNILWVKENLHLDIPMEFVECSKKNVKNYALSSSRDVEEIHLMSLCKHNIMANSTFSFWGAWLNQNPDKKVFIPMPLENINNKKDYRGFRSERKENSTIDSDKWIRVPFDLKNQSEVVYRPIFSLLLVVNNDIETIVETLDSILGQDYKYYEVVIIDNASTDGSGKICQEAIKGKENVTFKKLWTKVKNAEAWNMALNMTREGGYYVSFLKGNDRFRANALTTLYLVNQHEQADIVHSFAWYTENKKGNVKYIRQCDSHFQNKNNYIMANNENKYATKLPFQEQINKFLGTKIYNHNFLLDNGIKFDERLADDEAELFFQMECFFKSKHFMYAPNAFYIAPKNSLEQYPFAIPHNDKAVKVDDYDAQIISRFNRYFTARMDVKIGPKTKDEDVQILFVSDDKANVWKLPWKDTSGYAIHSYVGKLEFIAKAMMNGQIQLQLRGLWVPTSADNPKAIPYWVDYTKFTVNGKVIFETLTPAWCYKPYTYTMDVKAGEEITAQVEWLPHRSDT